MSDVTRRRRARRKGREPGEGERIRAAFGVALAATVLFGGLAYLAGALGWTELVPSDLIRHLAPAGTPSWARTIGGLAAVYGLLSAYALLYAFTLARVRAFWPGLIGGALLWAAFVGLGYPDVNTRVVTLSLFVLASLMIGASLVHAFSNPCW
ncbi:hypothetical protein [Hydrogenibacillus schlegelii]|uniref:hypothetical protein n=1 Tax=Hydrogenibacillus schlegelii TaxID=1484 RepID=UPI0012E36032|nr:hypothetical protein [Hydrogenibacillus schlegelii]